MKDGMVKDSDITERALRGHLNASHREYLVNVRMDMDGPRWLNEDTSMSDDTQETKDSDSDPNISAVSRSTKRNGINALFMKLALR